MVRVQMTRLCDIQSSLRSETKSVLPSFIHLFIQAISVVPLQVHSQRHSQHSSDTLSEFHTEVPQATVSDLPKAHTWRLEWGSNPRSFGRKATNLPMSHHAPPLGPLSFLCVTNLSGSSPFSKPLPTLEVLTLGVLPISHLCKRQRRYIN